MKVIGMDPGLRNFGICVAEVDPESYKVDFLDMTTLRTTPCDTLIKAQDLIMRADNMTHDIIHFVEKGHGEADIFAMCVEGFSRPPSVTSAIMLGAAHGIVGALTQRWNPEVIHVQSPQAIRKSLIELPKKKTPPEEMVHEMLLNSWPEVKEWHSRTPKYMHEHVLDAVAAVASASSIGRFLP